MMSSCCEASQCSHSEESLAVCRSCWYKQPQYKHYWQHYRKALLAYQHHYCQGTKGHRLSAYKRSTDINRVFMLNWWQHYCNSTYWTWHTGRSDWHQQQPTCHQASKSDTLKQTSVSCSNKQRLDNRLEHCCVENPDISDAADGENFEMEITDDFMAFLAQSAQHRKERGDETKRQVICLAPTQPPGQRRTSDMQWLYGRGAAMIHGMETAVQLNFDRNQDIKTPRLWPHLPINIRF